MAGIQKHHETTARSEEAVVDMPAAPTEEEQAAKAEKDAKLDDLLDEVDTVLEPNAEEFVKHYVQKGGQ